MYLLVNFLSVTDIPTDHLAGLYYSIWLGVSILFCAVGNQMQLYYSTIAGTQLRALTIALIYRKALTIDPLLLDVKIPSHLVNKGMDEKLNKLSTGMVLNLISSDSQQFLNSLPLVHQLWAMPLTLAVCIYFMYDLLGWVIFIGIGISLFVVPISLWISWNMRYFRSRQLEATDIRVALCKELVEGIRIVKLYSWEDKFKKKIETMRNFELDLVKKFISYLGNSIVSGNMLPVVSVLGTMVTFVAIGGDMKGANVFATMGYFTALRQPMGQFGAVLTAGASLSSAWDRIIFFLQAPDQTPVNKQSLLTSLDDSNSADKVEDDMFAPYKIPAHHSRPDALKAAISPQRATCASLFPDKSVLITAENASFSWDVRLSPVLKHLSFEVPRGAFVCILGSTGSGKSSFVRALLGNMRQVSGSLKVNSSLIEKAGLVTQEAWVTNHSLRENIVFGRPFDLGWYKQVLSSCGLLADLKQLPHGDHSVLGERGNTLSGGQKQRVGMARAIYSKPSLMLMDDPFSALDASTAGNVFDSLLGGDGVGMLRDGETTTVLISAQAHYALAADWVIILDTDGSMSYSGTPMGMYKDEKAVAAVDRIEQEDAESFVRGSISVSSASPLVSALVAPKGQSLSSFTLDHVASRAVSYDRLNSRGISFDRLDSAISHIQRPSTLSILQRQSSMVGGLKSVTLIGKIMSEAALAQLSPEAIALEEEMRKNLQIELHQAMENLTEDPPHLVGLNAVDKKVLKQQEFLEILQSGEIIVSDNDEGEIETTFFGSLANYLHSCGGIVWVGSLWVIVIVFERGFYVSCDIWMSRWTAEIDPRAEYAMYVIVYCFLNAGAAIFVLARTRVICNYALQSAKRLFDRLMTAIFYAPSAFFDVTPLGRSLTRVSYDMEQVDTTLVSKLIPYIGSIGWFGAAIGVLIWVLFPWAFIGVPVIFGVYGVLIASTRKAIQQFQTLDTKSRGPLQSHVAESLSGTPIIRTMQGAKENAIRMCDYLVDESSRAVFCFNVSSRWLGIRTEIFGVIITFLVGILCWQLNENIPGGRVGVVLVWCFNITQSFGYFSMFTSQYEAAMVSIDRVFHYGRIPTERGRSHPFRSEQNPYFNSTLNPFEEYNKLRINDGLQPIPIPDSDVIPIAISTPEIVSTKKSSKKNGDLEDMVNSLVIRPIPSVSSHHSSAAKYLPVTPPEDWPRSGLVEFKNVWMAYRPNLQPALKGVSFKAFPGERVAIVGRTGAGKSSLSAAIFRMVESWSPETLGGGVFVDGLELSTLELSAVRSKSGGICIVSQDPLVFSGTLRFNLDPFEEVSDEFCLQALHDVGLYNKVNGDLLFAVDDRGANFSIGERQLLCLARALLKRPKVLVLDEATASVDNATDEMVQETLRTADAFQGCTMITVAHRLLTIADYDRVVVMEFGRVMESDHPHTLLSNVSKKSHFRRLVEASGPVMASRIAAIAKETFEARNNSSKNNLDGKENPSTKPKITVNQLPPMIGSTAKKVSINRIKKNVTMDPNLKKNNSNDDDNYDSSPPLFECDDSQTPRNDDRHCH